MVHELTFKTAERSDFVEITRAVQEVVSEEGLQHGLVSVFVPHTTAGITINEHADPDVVTDMKEVLDRLIPWDNGYRHAEGNTAAHVKASMMGASAHIHIEEGGLSLGRWQGIFLCEFDGPRTRTVRVQCVASQ